MPQPTPDVRNTWTTGPLTRAKWAMVQQGISYGDLADATGLSHRTIRSVVNVHQRPTGRTLYLLSNALNVEPSTILDARPFDPRKDAP